MAFNKRHTEESKNKIARSLIGKIRKPPSEWTYKKRAFKLLNNKCFHCGSINKLQVHHLDGNRNNNPSDGSNWRIVCVKCHHNVEHLDVVEVRTKRLHNWVKRHGHPLQGVPKSKECKEKISKANKGHKVWWQLQGFNSLQEAVKCQVQG